MRNRGVRARKRETLKISIHDVGEWVREVKAKDGVNGFSNDFVGQVLLQLCLGLDHMHSLHMAHGDIKMDNVFITSTLDTKVTFARNNLFDFD